MPERRICNFTGEDIEPGTGAQELRNISLRNVRSRNTSGWGFSKYLRECGRACGGRRHGGSGRGGSHSRRGDSGGARGESCGGEPPPRDRYCAARTGGGLAGTGGPARGGGSRCV